MRRVWGNDNNCVKNTAKYLAVSDFFPYKPAENPFYFIKPGANNVRSGNALFYLFLSQKE